MDNALQVGFQVFPPEWINVVGNKCQQCQNRKAVIDLPHETFIFTQIVKQREQPEKEII